VIRRNLKNLSHKNLLSVSTIIAKWLERSLDKTQYHKRSNTEMTQWFIPWFGQVAVNHLALQLQVLDPVSFTIALVFLFAFFFAHAEAASCRRKAIGRNRIREEMEMPCVAVAQQLHWGRPSASSCSVEDQGRTYEMPHFLSPRSQRARLLGS
jgi:hypothetical protein